jgi:hypothetical protein
LARFPRYCCLLLFFSLVQSEENKREFDYHNLAGYWKGSGEVAPPFLPTSIDIDGSAEFRMDSSGKFMHTAVASDDMLLPYSDTGQLWFNPKNDSIYWAVWDSWGKHAIYNGEAKSGIVRGVRKTTKGTYEATARFVSNDSLHFTLMHTDTSGASKRLAFLALGRSQKED